MQGKETVLCFVCVFSHVAIAWTVDLPEVRKQHFKHGKESDKNIYDNIENTSKLSDENIAPHDIYRDKYADDYEYLGYREKEISHDNIQQGNQYLEGLRKSINQYARVLDYCQRFNSSKDSDKSQNDENPESETADKTRETCERATLSREHVRRLAELAVFTTKQLQDLEYEARYRKRDEDKEKDLLMKLAFFLDELAHFTGFVPYPERVTETTSETTTETVTTLQPLLNLNFLQVPEDVKNKMISCLKSNGSEAATDRCAFPLPLPPILRSLFNLTDSFANDSVTNTAVPQQSISQQPNEPSTSNTSPDLAVTAVRSDIFPRRTKRSIDDDPLQNVLQYYLKYHTWLNSNLKPITNDKATDKVDYSIANDLKKSILKRSVDKSNHLPTENPFQVLHGHLTSPRELAQTEINLQVDKIKIYLDKIRNSGGTTAEKHSQNVEKASKSITTRSIYYERPIRPIIAKDPYQDFTTYVKNKPGVNYNSDFVQATQARASLESAFQNGNLAVIERFGSNFNPLVPSTFYLGIAQSLADV